MRRRRGMERARQRGRRLHRAGEAHVAGTAPAEAIRVDEAAGEEHRLGGLQVGRADHVVDVGADRVEPRAVVERAARRHVPRPSRASPRASRRAAARRPTPATASSHRAGSRGTSPHRGRRPSTRGRRSSAAPTHTVPTVEHAFTSGRTSSRSCAGETVRRSVVSAIAPFVIDPPDTDETQPISGPLPASTR